MMATISPMITNLVQVCVVVRNLEATMKDYVEIAGIGPWAVFDFGAPDVSNILVRGKPATFRVKLALTWTKDSMWEIIQPADGHSPYNEFLDKRGEGMHHVLVQHSGHKFDEAIAHFRARGCELLMTFEFRGTRFAFIDATRELKMYLEIIERPPEMETPKTRPATPPAYWYPAEPPAGHVW
jgi:methylmalonyl-CoA/ethylmalonyl-CoA epimerase